MVFGNSKVIYLKNIIFKCLEVLKEDSVKKKLKLVIVWVLVFVIILKVVVLLGFLGVFWVMIKYFLRKD